MTKEDKPPFDPPTPEPVSALEVVGGVAAGLGIVAFNEATGRALELVELLPDMDREDEPVDLGPVLATLADTSAPARDADGNAACSRCGQYVAYETMSLNEHGYFCAPCAAKLTDEALR